jgi:DNA-binding SARP family transcriptional activator
MEFGILGPLTFVRDGEAVRLGALKLRTLLIRLMIEPGQTVPAGRLIIDLWEDGPPAGAETSLRAYVSNLRRVLGDAASDLVTRGGGYALELAAHTVDAERFATALESARGQRAGNHHQDALSTVESALGLWRGPALADVTYADFAQPTIRRLEELRNLAREERTASLLALGRHETAVPELESMITTEPLRERPYRQLSLALYRSDRTPEALEVHRLLRERLADELGLDPSPRYDALVARILRQDPELDVADDKDPGSLPQHGRRGGGSGPFHTASFPPKSGRRNSEVVGREPERRQLADAIGRLASGDGGLVLITGEPGIGKTTLLEELARYADEFASIHRGQCPESEGAPAFWPWRQVLRSVIESSPTGAGTNLERWQPVQQLLPEVAERYGVARPQVHDPVKARFELFEATAGLLAEVATIRPQVLILDDLQWADPASLELLAFLAEQLGSAPILLAASYRSAPADRSATLQSTLARLHRRTVVVGLELEGLKKRDIAELVGAGGRASDASEVASLHDRTAGNPFFVSQLVRFMREDPARRADGAIPTGVRHVIANRLQLLPASTQGLLEAAAVAGRSFDTRLVATVTDRAVEDVLDELDLAHDHELIEPEDPAARRHRFVHPLIQETLRDGLPPTKRAHLHVATARALGSSREAPPEQFAEHLWLAGDLAPRGDTVRALAAAADAAAESLAYEQAEMLLRRALDVLVAGAEVDIDAEVSIRSRLLNLLTTVTGWSSAELAPIADRVWQLADEVGLRPDLLPLWHLLWTGLTARGEMERSREVAVELRRRAEAADDALYIHTADLLLGYLDIHAGVDLPETLRRIVAAREGLDRQPDEHLAATPEHLGVTARLIEVNARGIIDDPETRIASQDLIAYARQVGRPFSRMAANLFAALAAAAQRDAAAAADWAQAGLDLCEHHGFAGARHLFVPVDGWARVQLGADASQQVPRISESVTALEASRGQVAPQPLTLYAEVLVRAGEPHEARNRLEQARRFVEATGEHVYDEMIDDALAALPTSGTGRATF